MVTGPPWFPDLLAAWCDAFYVEKDSPEVDDWRRNRPPQVNEWTRALLRDPNTFAERLDSRIMAADTPQRSEERYRALQAASDAIREAGIIHVQNRGGPGWDEIRQQWRVTGTLTRLATGLLLPRRSKPWAWQKPRPEAKNYDPGSHFEAFVRWTEKGDSGLEVRVRVLPELSIPIETIAETLTVAVVPLVPRIDDFAFEPIDSPSGSRKFRVSLKRPDVLEAAVKLSLEKAAKIPCDVVLFPELCFTPAVQRSVGSAVRNTSRRFGGRPWLVIAGSAHTPRTGERGQFHNRAVAFDGAGTECLQYNKLHRYEINAYEQDRYGIVNALKEIPRIEDIVTIPRVLEILETPIGRIAVMICEDLAAEFVEPLIHALEIDWLFVPVMDGAQTKERWTAVRAGDDAGTHGTWVLVGTCSALMRAHRAYEKKARRPDPGTGVGLLALGGRKEDLHILSQVGASSKPVTYMLTR